MNFIENNFLNIVFNENNLLYFGVLLLIKLNNIFALLPFKLRYRCPIYGKLLSNFLNIGTKLILFVSSFSRYCIASCCFKTFHHKLYQHLKLINQ